VASGLRYEHSIADADVERALALLSEEDIRAAAAAAVVKRRRRHPEEPTNATVSDLLRRGFTVDVAKAAVAADVPPKFESPW
jgi:SOS response regulatory protein OraA/RecX